MAGEDPGRLRPARLVRHRSITDVAASGREGLLSAFQRHGHPRHMEAHPILTEGVAVLPNEEM
jgi:hypothetical protein